LLGSKGEGMRIITDAIPVDDIHILLVGVSLGAES